MRLHNTWRYSGLPPAQIEDGILSGKIRAFRLESQHHKKLRGPRKQYVLVNVSSLDSYIEELERQAAQSLVVGGGSR
jgi:hypothetical protein